MIRFCLSQDRCRSERLGVGRTTRETDVRGRTGSTGREAPRRLVYVKFAFLIVQLCCTKIRRQEGGGGVRCASERWRKDEYAGAEGVDAKRTPPFCLSSSSFSPPELLLNSNFSTTAPSQANGSSLDDCRSACRLLEQQQWARTRPSASNNQPVVVVLLLGDRSCHPARSTEERVCLPVLPVRLLLL